MSDRNAEFASVGRISTALIVLSGILMVLPSVLLVASVLDGFGQASATVGFILAEALVLYVGYGVLIRVASPAVRDRLVST